MRPKRHRTVKRAAVLLGLVLLPAFACQPDRSGKPADRDSGSKTVSLREFRQGIRKAGIWSGGPNKYFADVGRDTLASAIRHGLMPDHKVLDVGAGSLRVAWWLLQYIEPSNYYAIEPVRDRIDTAAEILGVKDEINIYYNTDFEFPARRFDFVIARSIWTHASKPMIAKMLAEFAENAAASGSFLTSVRLAESEAEDYMGDEWVGKVLKSDPRGMVAHSPEWIEAECKKHGLSWQITGELNRQTWLLIKRAQE